jgi:hypothetical protein
MKRIFQTIITASVFVGTCAVGFGGEDLKAPAIAFFDAAAKGEADSVAKFYAELPNRGAQKVLEDSASVVRYVGQTKTKKEVLDLQKVDGDLGVIVFLDKPGDPDPIFMQKQQGTWKILSFGDYKPKDLGFDDTKQAQLDALKAWFKQEKQTLRAQRKK